MKFLRSPRVWMAAWLALGLFASAYLLVVYVTGGPIECGADGGCEVVRASAWAYLGPVPRPLLGLAFYAAMLALLLLRALTPWQERRLRWLMLRLALVGFIESAHLFYLQLAVIKAFCLWCLASGVATVGVLAAAVFDRASLTESQRLDDLNGYAMVFAVLGLVGAPALFLLLR